jgi:TetR/AcrR family transcriptional regulator, transcriptional repressor for nem operon
MRVMARYSPEHKETTRRRMIETAGRRFKRDGFDGSGISTLVADAGLTNGAFYGHFASKDDLIASVVTQQLADQAARVEALPIGPASVEAFLREYLSPAHRDDVAGGCPSAALLDEIGRCDAAIRRAYTDGARTIIDAIARHLDAGDEQDANERAIGLFTLLVGSLEVARAVTEPELSDRILTAAYAHAMTIARARPHPATPTDQASK